MSDCSDGGVGGTIVAPCTCRRGTGLYSIVCEGTPGTLAASGIASAAVGGESNTASGDYSTVMGFACVASNLSARASGILATASGAASESSGFSTLASGDTSHAEGSLTTAIGDGSHAEGSDTIATGDFSHATGGRSNALRAYQYSHGNPFLGAATLAQYWRAEITNVATAATVNLFLGDGAEVSLENGRAYMIRVLAAANRSTGAERAGFVREILVFAEGGVAAISATLSTIDSAPVGWTLVHSAPGGLVLRFAFTVPAGVTARCCATLQVTEINRL